MKTRIIPLIFLLMLAFNAEANSDTDDTLKVYRMNFSNKIEHLTFSGYCKVEVVNDTVEYLECFDPTGSASTKPKGLTYGYRSNQGKFNHFSLEAIPGVGRMCLHLVMDAFTTIRTEDYAQIDVVCPAHLVMLSVFAEDYSKVNVRALQGIDTIRARRIRLFAEDFSSVALTTPCIADDFIFKATDYAKVDVTGCVGTNMWKVEEDRAKVTIAHSDVANANSIAEGDDYLDESEALDELDKLSEGHNPIATRKSKTQSYSDDFRFDFLWGFLNWGDKPYNGLSRMEGSYALNTTFSSYQLEAVYYPFVNSTWHLGIGLGYTSDVFKFVDPWVSLGTDPTGKTTFVSSVPDYGDATTRLVARYVTLPLMVRWEPSISSDFFIGLAAIPGLNFNNFHTGLKHKVVYPEGTDKRRENASRVMNPFCLDARLSMGMPNLYAYLQLPTIPMNVGMDKDVYPIKLGIAISLGDDD
ncbi:MAG: hypothetical protein J5641_00340 [Bacteroidales bacterium]|nr:hypothetical protein [Bacteroidales bacterium]